MEKAAERLGDRIKHADMTDPILRHMDAAEFLRNKGFDISTFVGCKGALVWLEEAKVEDAFWEEGKIDNAADWYLGEARIEAMKKIVQDRLEAWM